MVQNFAVFAGRLAAAKVRTTNILILGGCGLAKAPA